MNCPAETFCNKNHVEPSTIKHCNNFEKLDERLIFASENNLIPRAKEIFSNVFWIYHDMVGAKISIRILKDNFENPSRIFPEMNPQSVKDQIYIETLMKFCKFAEDLGGLITSRDKDMFEFAQKFSKYNVKKVISFYKSLPLDNNKISEIFSYPKIEIQKSGEAKSYLQNSHKHIKDSLEEIKEDYLKYRSVYNSYKHGYRIRFKKMEMTMGDEGSGTKKYNRVLLYYDKETLKENKFMVSMVAYEKYSDFDFVVIYDSCLAIIRLIEVFLNNLKQSQIKSTNKSINLFFSPTMGYIMKDFFNKEIEFVY